MKTRNKGNFMTTVRFSSFIDLFMYILYTHNRAPKHREEKLN